MTEEIKYYKEKEYPLKWILAEELEETPQQTIDRLKQENETIREHCKQVDETNKILYQEKCELIQENEKLRKENERLAETPQWRQIKDMANNNNYRKALEEIREVAITRDLPPCLNSNCNCDICHDKITEHGQRCMQKGMSEILDKIDEVLK